MLKTHRTARTTAQATGAILEINGSVMSILATFLAKRHTAESMVREAQVSFPYHAYALFSIWPAGSEKCDVAVGVFKAVHVEALMMHLFAMPEGSIIAVYARDS